MDSKLSAGDRWREEIEQALSQTAVAILLISADFLASEFIATNELPTLLDACRTQGVRIIPVLLKPCALEISPLGDYQCVNDPKHPVSGMEETEQEALWTEVARTAYRDYQRAMAAQAIFHEPSGSQAGTILNEYSQMSLGFYEEDVYDSRMVHDDGEAVYTYSSTDHEAMYECNVPVFLSHLLSDPDEVLDYKVYTYQFIDVLDFLPKADALAGDLEGFPKLMDRVQTLFMQHGWEGDGNIRLLWFPPFVDAGMEDTWGTLAFFVKQLNNGISFIASPVPLNFTRL